MKYIVLIIYVLISLLPVSASGKASEDEKSSQVHVESFEYTKKINSGLLGSSLLLGRRFFLKSLNPRGDFYPIYDFIKKEHRVLGRQRIQAGAFWSLAAINLKTPSQEATDACIRGVRFFAQHSKSDNNNGLYLVYPEVSKGETGAVALLVLGIIDLLRTDIRIDSDIRSELKEYLDGYIKFLVSMVKEEGDLFSYYNTSDGSPMGGSPSPYSDGETLLALVRSVKYADHPEYMDIAGKVSDTLYRMYVQMPLSVDRNSKYTRAFFSWMALSYMELTGLDHQNTSDLTERTISLAHWVIDEQNILKSTTNSAYFQQGLIAAWEMARLAGDKEAMQKIGYVVDRTLYKLSTWQVGNDLQNEYLIKSQAADVMSVGGIMTRENDPVLRLNIAGYQMNSVIMALIYIYE